MAVVSPSPDLPDLCLAVAGVSDPVAAPFPPRFSRSHARETSLSPFHAISGFSWGFSFGFCAPFLCLRHLCILRSSEGPESPRPRSFSGRRDEQQRVVTELGGRPRPRLRVPARVPSLGVMPPMPWVPWGVFSPFLPETHMVMACNKHFRRYCKAQNCPAADRSYLTNQPTNKQKTGNSKNGNL